ncbi:hypothetical protein MXD60_17640 [Frankia sp. AgB32]|nr:hypothetical protein [Frankia sp. AgB32]
MVLVLAMFTAALFASNSASSTSVLVVFLGSGLALLGDIVLLLVHGFRSDAQLTATISVSGLFAGAAAWAFKAIRESLSRRAQVLILEYLSEGDLDRATIRSGIYDDGILFRLNRSLYVDALSYLLTGDRIRIVNGRDAVPSTGPGGAVRQRGLIAGSRPGAWRQRPRAPSGTSGVGEQGADVPEGEPEEVQAGPGRAGPGRARRRARSSSAARPMAQTSSTGLASTRMSAPVPSR